MTSLKTSVVDSELAGEQVLRQALLEYQAILDNAPLGVAFTRDRRFLRSNPRVSEMFGWSSEELADQLTYMVYPSAEAFDDLTAQAIPALSAGLRLDVELQMKRRDGSLFWCRMMAKAIDPEDHSAGTIFITEDITERRQTQEALLQARDDLELRVQERTTELAAANLRLREEIQERRFAEEQLSYCANHDALTGLPNRRLLMDRLAQAMILTKRHGDRLAIMFIDLDCFKQVNDRLGHRVGDLSLQAVAGRLRHALREVDTIARVGGDEFVLVLPHMTSDDAVNDTAQKILAALSAPYLIEEVPLMLTPSIGISIFPKDGADEDTLISRADAAMYRAKQLGRCNVQIFDADVVANRLQGTPA